MGYSAPGHGPDVTPSAVGSTASPTVVAGPGPWAGEAQGLALFRTPKRIVVCLPDEVDAVVVGAGPNGLAAANHLVDAGWEVLLLEAEPGVGGAVRSDREVHPDFLHDTFSAFYPMAAASPVMRGFALEEHGLTCRTPRRPRTPVPGRVLGAGAP